MTREQMIDEAVLRGFKWMGWSARGALSRSPGQSEFCACDSCNADRMNFNGAFVATVRNEFRKLAA